MPPKAKTLTPSQRDISASAADADDEDADFDRRLDIKTRCLRDSGLPMEPSTIGGMHLGALVGWRMGGPDPLRGTSIYPSKCKSFWHYVGTGLYQELGQEHEFTMRVLRRRNDMAPNQGVGWEPACPELCNEYADGDSPPQWPLQVLNTIARYELKTGNSIGPGDHMPFDPAHVGVEGSTMSGVLFVDDPGLGCYPARGEEWEWPGCTDTESHEVGGKYKKDTGDDYDKLRFLQIVCVTAKEHEALRSWTGLGFAKLLATVKPNPGPLLMNDMYRSCVMEDDTVSTAVKEGRRRDGSRTGMIASKHLLFHLQPTSLVIRLHALALPYFIIGCEGVIPFGRTLHIERDRTDPLSKSASVLADGSVNNGLVSIFPIAVANKGTDNSAGGAGAAIPRNGGSYARQDENDDRILKLYLTDQVSLALADVVQRLIDGPADRVHGDHVIDLDIRPPLTLRIVVDQPEDVKTDMK